MTENKIDLADIFQSVTKALSDNQQSLDEADEYNHDHGSNMVQTFETITDALDKKKGSSDSAALRFAAKQLSKTTTSSSGKLYAEHLNQAADQFKGKRVDSRGGLDLLHTLIGGGQTAKPVAQSGEDILGSLVGTSFGGAIHAQQETHPSQSDPLGGLMGSLIGSGQSDSSGSTSQTEGGADLLGALLGGLTGGGASTSQQPSPAGGNLLGALLGGLTGGGAPASQQASPAGGDMLGSLLGGLTESGSGQGGSGGSSLLNAAMAFFQAKQQGGSTAQALIQAFMGASRMGDASHRTQSTQVVVESFLQALSSSAGK